MNSLLLTAFTVSMLLVGVNASATSTPLTWQDEVDVKFTFNPALSVTISDGDIIIPNLGVGTRDNSNEIAITVTTNNIAGYQLSATVGNSSTYDYRELKHETTNTALFNSLAVGTTLNQLSTPSTWGYSTDSGTSYSGLPKYDDTTNVAVLNDSTASGTETTNFLIGAYADQNQLAGDYKNVINFNIVTNRVPVTWEMAYANAGKTKTDGYYSIQDATSAMCAEVDMNETITVRDVRDDETYLIGKLADNKCWMLENLNLAGGTALSASDTNVDSSYISSFTTSNRLTKNGDIIVLPASSTSGFSSNNYSYVYNSGNKTNCGASGQDTPCYSYYSWDAATLGSGRIIVTDNTDAPYSICPKGWRLPTAYSTSATNWQTADFYTLAHKYGLDSTTSTSESDDGFYTQAGPGTVPNFLTAGNYGNGSFVNGGSVGSYWSATSGTGAGDAYYSYFSSISVYSAREYFRYYGRSVRCLLQ